MKIYIYPDDVGEDEKLPMEKVYLNWDSPVGIYQPQADDRDVEEYLFDPLPESNPGISPYLRVRYKRGEFVMYRESESLEKFFPAIGQFL